MCVYRWPFVMPRPRTTIQTRMIQKCARTAAALHRENLVRPKGKETPHGFAAREGRTERVFSHVVS
jgi:hypothetical protein